MLKFREKKTMIVVMFQVVLGQLKLTTNSEE